MYVFTAQNRCNLRRLQNTQSGDTLDSLRERRARFHCLSFNGIHKRSDGRTKKHRKNRIPLQMNNLQSFISVINAVNALQPKLSQLTSPISQKDSQWRQRRHGKIYKKLFKEGPQQSEILHYVIGIIAYLFITQNPTRKKNSSMFLPSSAASNFF